MQILQGDRQLTRREETLREKGERVDDHVVVVVHRYQGGAEADDPQLCGVVQTDDWPHSEHGAHDVDRLQEEHGAVADDQDNPSVCAS